MVLRTHEQGRNIKSHQTRIHKFNFLPQLDMTPGSSAIQPELIGKPVITDNPDLLPLAASILTGGDKSTIF